MDICVSANMCVHVCIKAVRMCQIKCVKADSVEALQEGYSVLQLQVELGLSPL